MELDQQAVNLAKAIRQVETGNRPVTGASGELASRYQFMPATWKGAAKEILGDENAPLTLENENKVAYSRIKKWKDAGYGPAQIASLWNSGSPQWEGKVGVNKMGVKYDVPGYVAKVGAAYKQLKGETVATPKPVPEAPKKEGLLSRIASVVPNLAIGAVKGIGSTLAGAQSLGEKIISAPQKALGMKTLTETAGRGKTVGEEIKDTGMLTPKGTAQKVGFGAEQIAEYMVPGLTPTKALKATAGASKLTRAGLALGRTGLTSAEIATKAALQKGTVKDVPKDLAASAATIGALSVAGKAAKGLGKLALGALGKSTGAGTKALELNASNPKVIQYARQASKSDQAHSKLVESALTTAKKGLQSEKGIRSLKYKAQKTILKGEKVDYGEILENAKNAGAEALKEAGVTVGKTAKLSSNKFLMSPIGEGQNQVSKAWSLINSWKDTTPDGLDSLKKRLYQVAKATGNKNDGSYQVVKKMADSVSDGLKSNIPGYSKMMDEYARRSAVIKEVENALSLGDKASKNTAIAKLMSLLGEKGEYKNEVLKMLGKKTYDEVMAKMSGVALSSWTPVRGLSAGLFGPAALISVSHLQSLLPLLAGSSPRLMAEATALISSLKGKVVPPKTKEAFLGLVLRAMREKENPAP